MSQLITTTHADFPGPLLIDREALEKFDAMFHRETTRIREATDASRSIALQQEIDRQIHRHQEFHPSEEPSEELLREFTESANYSLRSGRGLDAERIALVVEFKSGKRVESQSFARVFRMPESVNERPTSFELEYSCGGLRCSVKAPSVWDSNGLSIRVNPDGAEDSKELFGAIGDWCSSVAPNLYVRGWAASKYLLGPFLFALIVTLALGTGHMKGHTNSDRARVLAEQGVKPGGEDEALKVLLALAVDYDPGDTRVLFSPGWWSALVACLMGILVTSLHPTFELGIGRGVGWIKFWRWFGRFVFSSVPLFLLLRILLPLALRRL